MRPGCSTTRDHWWQRRLRPSRSSPCGAALGLAIALLFAWRLEAGVLLLVLARPSLDVFADRSLASYHGLALNPASVLAVLVIGIGVPYMVEAWRRLRTAPVILPYLLF